ncbi:hypothetical protein [Methanobrevibacter sp. DSM 116169]|uniref:hypothetical protein n=1 Tax=Methanobrevibacter sp. DSM 116169 TaxID=3242727 RepID=UPI0038FD235B
MKKILIYNKTENKLLNQEFQCNNSFYEKFKGLMLNKDFNKNLIFKFNSKNRYNSSIHTFFMCKSIYIYFIDKNYRVFEIIKLKPWKIAIPKKEAKFVLESYNKINLKINDEIKIQCHQDF